MSLPSGSSSWKTPYIPTATIRETFTGASVAMENAWNYVNKRAIESHKIRLRKNIIAFRMELSGACEGEVDGNLYKTFPADMEMPLTTLARENTRLRTALNYQKGDLIPMNHIVHPDFRVPSAPSCTRLLLVETLIILQDVQVHMGDAPSRAHETMHAAMHAIQKELSAEPLTKDEINQIDMVPLEVIWIYENKGLNEMLHSQEVESDDLPTMH